MSQQLPGALFPRLTHVRPRLASGALARRLIVPLFMCVGASTGLAQEYPSRPIIITVPNPPGGMNQIHAQPLSAILERLTGQPVPIVNRPGGTAAVGTAYVANQPPDGYNVLINVPNIFLVIEKDKLFGVKTPYSLDQIALLALLSADPVIMVVHPSMPVKNPKELAALARSKPNEIIFSSSGPYGITHVPTAMFMDAAGIKMRHLPTTGGGPALLQALGGHSQITGGGPAALYPHVSTGKLRAIASYGAKSHPALPNVPTFKSQGIDIEAYLWVGLFTAAGVPDPTIKKLRELIGKAANDSNFKKALENVNVVPDYRDAPGFNQFFNADYQRMSAAIRKIGKI